MPANANAVPHERRMFLAEQNFIHFLHCHSKFELMRVCAVFVRFIFWSILSFFCFRWSAHNAEHLANAIMWAQLAATRLFLSFSRRLCSDFRFAISLSKWLTIFDTLFDTKSTEPATVQMYLCDVSWRRMKKISCLFSTFGRIREYVVNYVSRIFSRGIGSVCAHFEPNGNLKKIIKSCYATLFACHMWKMRMVKFKWKWQRIEGKNAKQSK